MNNAAAQTKTTETFAIISTTDSKLFQVQNLKTGTRTARYSLARCKRILKALTA